MNGSSGKAEETRGYAPIDDLKMYYEIDGTGDPLVCIPPAFGYAGMNLFPLLVQGHSVMTVDLQGHGHTADIPDRPITLEQHAQDVVELAVIPDAGHFALFSEQERVIPVVKQFLEKSENKIPIATANTGYRPGETR